MRKFESIRWRLTLSYAAIAMLAAFSLGLVLRTILRNYYDQQEMTYLQNRAIEISSIASQLLEADLPEQVIQDLSRSWSFVLGARVRVLDMGGNQVADSGTPETQQVFFIASERPFPVPGGQTVTHPATEPGSQGLPPQTDQFFQIQILTNDIRPGTTEQKKDVILFNRDSVDVALPVDVTMNGLLDPNRGSPKRRSSQVVEQLIIGRSAVPIGRVLLSEGPAYGDEILNNVMNGWILAGIASVFLAGLAGWVVSTRIAMPLTELTKVTTRMAQGDLAARAGVQSNDEIGILGNSFNEMAERVEETVGTLRSFVADAAHELHTPLTALQANIALARDENNGSIRTQYLSRAPEQGHRLEALVQSLLDLSRIEGGEPKSNFGHLDFAQLIREVGEQFASRAEQADRYFSMRVSGEPLQVVGNETHLRQVLLNLLENALKFTPTSGSISIEFEHSQHEANLIISDTGIGIAPEDMPHLFER